jgi:hypothetical protein
VGVPVTALKTPPPAFDTTPCSIPVSQTADERVQNAVAAEKLLDGFDVVELKAEYVRPATVASTTAAAAASSPSRTG